MGYRIFFGCCLIIAVACNKKKAADPTPEPATPQLKMTVQPTFGTVPAALDHVFTTSEGFDVQFTDIKFFISNLKNGDQTLTDVAEFDYRTNGIACFQVPGTATAFSSLTGLIGVPQNLNHSDPSAFSSTNPLYISNSGDMHWDWNPGYIFIKIEAKVDTIPDGNPLFDHTLVYHIGTDTYAHTIEFPTVNWTATSANVSTAQLTLDLKHIIDNPNRPINIRKDNFTHSGSSQAVLTQKLLANFLEALTTP